MIRVLTVKIYNSCILYAIKNIVNISLFSKKNLCISATGAHGIITAQKDTKFKKLLNSFYMNLPDGMPIVWIGRLKGSKKIKRCYGPEFFKEVIIATRDKNIKHFFCGGKDGVAEALRKVCEYKYHNNNIVGTYSPPFREMTDEALQVLANQINQLSTDIVWVGLSTPKQEIFAHRLSKFTTVHFICTVGAAFDFHTGKVKQAPVWMQKNGFEWFFRFIIEPKRLWKRYFEIVPLFIWYNLLEFIKGDFYKNKSEVNNE